MYIRRKVFSTYINEETGEEKLFSTTEIISEESYLEQREFNSKAAKVLNNKYLKQVAAKNGIPVYESSKGFRTVEIDPKQWKKRARFENKFKRDDNIANTIINSKVDSSSASYIEPGFDKLKRFHKRLNLEKYDHGNNELVLDKSSRIRDLEYLKRHRTK